MLPALTNVSILLIVISLSLGDLRKQPSREGDVRQILTAEARGVFSAVLDHLDRGDLTAALQECRKVMNANPEDRKRAAYGHLLLGEIYYRQPGKLDLALESYQKAVDSSSLGAEAAYGWSKVGSCYTRQRENAKAHQAYDTILEHYATSPYVPGALFAKAHLYYMESKWEEAVNTYRQIVERFPDSPQAREALYEIAMRYDQQSKYEQMYATFDEIIKKYPGTFECELARWGLTTRLLQEKKFDAAIDAFRRFIEQHPSEEYRTARAVSQANIAACYLNLGKDGEAVREYVKVLEGYPGTPEARDAFSPLIDLHLKSRQYAEAIKRGRELITGYADRANPKVRANMYYQLGCSYEAAGSYQEALDAYKKVVEAEPKTPEPQKGVMTPGQAGVQRMERKLQDRQGVVGKQ